MGTVEPVTCNISTMVARYPLLLLPSRPTTVYESVYLRGTVLAGNQCPANSSTPTKPCEGGFYCPTPALTVPCPAGSYCKPGSQEPAKCPILASCPEGSGAQWMEQSAPAFCAGPARRVLSPPRPARPLHADKAALSWAGFILLAGVLIVLWVSYKTMITVLRLNQRRLGRTQAARERLWKLLNPLFASQHHSRSQAFRAFKAIRPKINVEFEDLGLTLHDGTAILSGVSGRFSHSRVAAIMGPSGAGKSTFLNVIMGNAAATGRVSGRIRVNGRDMRPEGLRRITGFVPQEDVVHEDLTVRENLVYSARLRLSSAKPLREQLAIVDDVVNVLQLRHVQHNMVGCAERRGISGGQRKRVNIGWELVAKPSVLYMVSALHGGSAVRMGAGLGSLRAAPHLRRPHTRRRMSPPRGWTPPRRPTSWRRSSAWRAWA
jgi:ABC-type phosphate transport system ATPase subunit